MKYYLFAIIIFPLLSFNVPDFNPEPDGTSILPASQLGPIYFFNTVPGRIKLNDKVILSFSRSSLISMYRYKLEIPDAQETRIDKSIVSWSSWKTEDIAAIIIPDLDVQGTYKFIVEYKTGTGTLTRRFEKSFEVYSLSNLASRARPAEPSPEVPVKHEIPAPGATQAATASGKQATAPASAAAAKQESPIPRQSERISAAESPAADNAAGRKETQSGTKSVITTSPAQPTAATRKIKPSDTPERVAPQIEKLALPASDFSLFVSDNQITIKRSVNYRFTGSAASVTASETEPVSAAGGRVEIEKPGTGKSAGSNILPENTNNLHALAAYDPPPATTGEHSIIEELPDDGMNTSVVDKISGTGILTGITLSDSLISQNEPAPGKDKDPPESLPETDEAISGRAASGTEENGAMAPEPANPENSDAISFNDLLLRAVGENDKALFRKSVLNGGGSGLTVSNGGNVFHLLNGTLGDEYSVSILKKNGNSIDKQDKNGNSPLHAAILKGDYDYAKCLINQGADLNLKNKMELAPLHMTAFLNDYRMSAFLMAKGAAADIRGNSGYTPLHIATELNNYEIVKQLLDHDAGRRQKTDQGLTPAAIAKIQKNNEIARLLAGSDIREKKKDPAGLTANTNYHVLDPMLVFSLPYNGSLAGKRQFFTVVQAVTAPLAVIFSAGTVYLKAEANNYHALSKTAETEEEARVLYNKTRKLDRSAWITGSFSIASVYGFIHSTVGKRNVTGKMYKTFK